jgi:Fic family protein
MDRLSKRLQFDAASTQQFYEQISKIDAIKGQWILNNTLSPQIVKRLQHSVLITSTGASTRIEGSQLSDDDIVELFDEMRIKKFKTRDQQEVAGYMELLHKVFEAHKDISFTESGILHFHNEMMRYSEKDQFHKGKYKKQSNRVEARDEKGELVGVIFDPSPPYLVQKEMTELIQWMSAALKENFPHPLLTIANFIFEFLAIHPFQDGNGRLSRILTNFLLLQQGYEFIPFVSHEKIIEENKADYYLALNKTQKKWKTKKEDMCPWMSFFLSVIHKQSELAIDLLKKEPIEVFLSEKQLLVWQFALKATTFSRKEVIESTKLSPRTAEEAVKKLLKMKKIERFGEGRATRYRIRL